MLFKNPWIVCPDFFKCQDCSLFWLSAELKLLTTGNFVQNISRNLLPVSLYDLLTLIKDLLDMEGTIRIVKYGVGVTQKVQYIYKDPTFF